jgi:hypothetical protein
MPAQSAWISRLSQIRADLEALPCSHLDRQAVEKLFGVSERRARQLMSGLPGMRVGNAIAVDKQALRGFLLQWSQGEAVGREQRRRIRLASYLEEARRSHAARQVNLAVQPSPRPTLLPEGVELGPGELRVRFKGAEDLAARLYALGQAMAGDWERFCQLVP